MMLCTIFTVLVLCTCAKRCFCCLLSRQPHSSCYHKTALMPFPTILLYGGLNWGIRPPKEPPRCHSKPQWQSLCGKNVQLVSCYKRIKASYYPRKGAIREMDVKYKIPNLYHLYFLNFQHDALKIRKVMEGGKLSACWTENREGWISTTAWALHLHCQED